ncbi:hypothetical protein A1O7_05864 [Cladophialophora yegresii CBS 114405]|uniref:Uncharacterized protein n=1 Tax=Cladophialophora yegresii CBS 114405 TaxID=1182544 RepID=W9WIW4_9EURO|nr:uncharacterized protein A1O7_05864 [Cladophialophora yegresii CBS 114405]EXJ58439.1 hypothetical protein A1O7_05864 [Cladophialophora yegresii CBS 114405]
MLLELRSFFRGSGRLADDSYARSLEGEAASRPSNDLLAVVKTFRGSVCSVVLDKVYALLSIVDWEGRQPLRVDYMIDEVLLYYRALSSARHVDFGYAEHLRRGLQIDQRLLLERSVQLFQDDAVAKLEIETAFSIAAYTGPNYDGEDGMIPPRFPRAFGKMPFSLHLHQGVVRQKDLLAQFRGTDVSLVFARVGTTGKYTVKGMIFTVWSSLLNHSIVHCPNRCLNDFSDIELELEDTPAISDVTHFVPIKAKSWLSLFRHHCQKGEASMVFNRKNNKST